jgi:hypothetical protein
MNLKEVIVANSSDVELDEILQYLSKHPIEIKDFVF